MSGISKKTMFILILAALVVGVIAFFGITTSQTQDADSGNGQAEDTQSDTKETENEEITDNSGENQDETGQDTEELFEIKTVYGILLYPSEWKDTLVTEETEEDSSCRVTFSTVIDGTTYELFTVIIGEEAADGMGTLTGTDGVGRTVTIEAVDLGDVSELSEEQQDQIYAMQEALNIVLENLE